MTVHAQEVEEFVVTEGLFLSKEGFELETRIDPVVEEEPAPTTEIVEEPVTVVEEPTVIEVIIENLVVIAETLIAEVEETFTPVEVETVIETPTESPVVVEVVEEPTTVTTEVGDFVIVTPVAPTKPATVRVFDGTFFGFNPAACQGNDAVVCIAASAAEELEDVVDEANKELKKKLKELQDDLEEDLEDNDAEEERRKRHPERGRNIAEQEELDGDRQDLDDEDERIGQKEDQLDYDDDVDDLLDQDLREAVQEARRNGDPNCRGSACQQLRSQRADLQGRRVDRMHHRTDAQMEREDYDRRNRDWHNQNNDLQDRLDRGEGMSHDERRLRNARTAYREYTNEQRRIANDIENLEDRERAKRADGGRLPPEEWRRLKALRREIKQAEGNRDANRVVGLQFCQ